jgi:ketosteroid isomerase-like protein
MSENLDLVRSIYADWERGDFGHAAEWADADIEYVLAGGGPADGSWRGLDGMAEGFRNYLSAWEDFRVQADEYRELDDGRVLVLTWYSGRGKTSGLNLGSTGARGATLFHVRGRVVTRLVTYATSDSALADLGLEE